MANNVFKTLALQYVLADDHETLEIATQAAAAIEGAASTRIAMAQWVQSINQWMPGGKPDDEEEDPEDDIIARAKALDFLARTLEFLKKDILKTDQVQLLINFFTSLFSSDHRAGVTASAKALRHLVAMKSFEASSSYQILIDAGKLGEDFKRQTPSTRLEIYELVLAILDDSFVETHALDKTYEFMASLVELCRNERDPQNLMKWFQIQKFFLQFFTGTNDDLTAEVFKAFSDYFPITLRASVTPSGITVDDLKGALRSCFASHHRIAHLAIPFLINKLDQGDAVTVSVKVDILQTLDACLVQYSDSTHGITPYADKIWASLKYEVRNGEILDTIMATVQVISTLTKRLSEPDLRTFLEAAWADLSDDLSDTTYITGASRLLIALAGASPVSFSLIARPAITQIETILKRSKSSSHQAGLLGLLNGILRVRLALEKPEKERAATSKYLQDETFGDAIFESVYARLWMDWTQSQPSNDRLKIISKLTEGMASLLNMEKWSDGATSQLCSNEVCSRIFNWLGAAGIMYPLEEKVFLLGSSDDEQDGLSTAACLALSRLVWRYPHGFQELLLQYLDSITNVTQTRIPSTDQIDALYKASSRLARISCGTIAVADGVSPIVNYVSFINAMLDGFHRCLQLSPSYWLTFIVAINGAIFKCFDTLSAKLPDKPTQAGNEASEQDLSKTAKHISGSEWFTRFSNQDVDGLPEIDLGKVGSIQKASESLNKLALSVSSPKQQFLGYSLFVVAQIYRRLTSIKQSSEKGWAIGLSADFDGSNDVAKQDRCLYQLSHMATIVIREFSEEDQKRLSLAEDIFVMFHREATTPDGTKFRTAVLGDGTQIKGQEKWLTISPLDGYRTAPLAQGIIEGLWPKAMLEVYSRRTLLELCNTLMSPDLVLSQSTQASLDNIMTTLANKYSASDELTDDWTRGMQALSDGFTMIMRRVINAGHPDANITLARFRTILHFISGCIVNFWPGEGPNWLLRVVCDMAPAEMTIGRQLAQCFEILVSPKECLVKENHTRVKRLHGQWIYRMAVSRYLDRCFPTGPGFTGQHVQDERGATNQSVAIFAILKHIDYAAWQDEAEQIIRVAIRSLTTFGVSKDINNVMGVLLAILDREPELLKQHITALITHILAIYQMARNVAETIKFMDPSKNKFSKGEGALCRKSCLEFLTRVPSVYEARYVLSQRRAALKALSIACGDPVREVREIAIEGRNAWTALS